MFLNLSICPDCSKGCRSIRFLCLDQLPNIKSSKEHKLKQVKKLNITVF